jgi:L-ribulose-5-phosphate 3-epimerase
VHQESILREFFDLLGDKILAVHAKDFIVDGGKISVVPPGKGLLDYELAKQSANEIDVLMENIKAVDMAGAKRFMEEIIGG